MTVSSLACAGAEVEPTGQSSNQVLILASSVRGGSGSREAVAAASFHGSEVHIATPEQWRAMTAEQFMTYRALVIGDGACQDGLAAFQAALDSRRAWGAIVDGNVAILSTDPTGNQTGQLVENALQFVLESEGLTGMYIALGCAYQGALPGTGVPLLEPFGAFQAEGVPGCADHAHLFEMDPATLSENLSDGMLSGAGCAVRSVFTAYPDHTFTFAALAQRSEGPPVPGQRAYWDFSQDPQGVAVVGTPYLVVRGAAARGAGCGSDGEMTGQECDLGDWLNGVPALPGQPAWETCSWSCRNNWCGDGAVDAIHGEECDEGINNGRAHDASGSIGTCSSFCQIPHVEQPPPQAPIARCKEVTAVATSTCGVPADIDDVSSDPDGDLVGCTQSPAGPYPIGTTAVTLTCVDRAGHTSTCSGGVTVQDRGAPTVALNGPANQRLECTAGATFTPPGVTANDLCEGPLPSSRITVTGSVNMGVPNTQPGYLLSYVATDSAGNRSAPAVLTVAVEDTLNPVLTLTGANPQVIACGTQYVDPGATAVDRCDGDLTSKITVSHNVNPSAVGQYAASYGVTDRVGHMAAANRQVRVAATEIHLSDYTLFLLENYSGGPDVTGKVAAGGNITLASFSIGEALPDNDVAQTLVAGGNLTLTRGSVWGQAFYGGQYSGDGTVTYHRGTVSRGTPINFAARFAALRSLSSQLASLSPTNVATRTPGGFVVLGLKGTNTRMNVFEVNASDFAGINQLSINAPAGSMVVINIRGASATLSNLGIVMGGGINQKGILYNFVDATTLQASSIGLWGTVLAPYARVTFNNGAWDGGIYAVSMTGTAEGHLNVLQDRAACP
ncbi:choice-of-anchor A family protein [Stigmatella sp. ncwal1]|uniref:Choice-of-anchor A family protein n=1 Tax=Stigmatella ashevillensis TaxID=2995309 RepID=A0ABT5DL06_9BACT|nr:choice-of-anchor A family protein [Stigmatella ashevillena]MDC0714355.1 choice-of-anchor A family protein [Stigmatella ashevillena]